MSTEIKERMEVLSVLNDTAKLAEALKVAMTALAWYGDEKHWSEDDWGCVAVIAHPDYANGGQKARNAIKRIERLTRPERVAESLREPE
jgi:hypothetical protein